MEGSASFIMAMKLHQLKEDLKKMEYRELLGYKHTKR
jgi:hypothetical protein